MSTGSGGKRDGGSSPEGLAVDAPHRLVVRSIDPPGDHGDSTILGAHDTAPARPGAVGAASAAGSGRSAVWICTHGATASQRSSAPCPSAASTRA